MKDVVRGEDGEMKEKENDDEEERDRVGMRSWWDAGKGREVWAREEVCKMRVWCEA